MSSPQRSNIGVGDVRLEGGPFGPEARELSDRLGAMGLVLIVLGSKRGSGSCFELNVAGQIEARELGLDLVTLLRDLAEKLEEKILVEGFPGDQDQHGKTE